MNLPLDSEDSLIAGPKVRFNRTRLVIVAVAVILCFICIVSQWFTWQGNRELHTLMEVVATYTAAIVGILAFVRYQAGSRRNTFFLFLATGFMGTALLDGYHALVTSSLLNYMMPSPPESLIPWSWNASRTFLGFIMAIMWFATRVERKSGRSLISERQTYLIVGGLTLASLCFFSVVPLPRAYYPEFFFGRPEEFFAAIFFAIALIGFTLRADLKLRSFDGWLVWSLLVGLVAQSVVMSRSFMLFDLPFDLAHSLKIVSYMLVLSGLIIDVCQLFEKLEDARYSSETLTDQISESAAYATSLAAQAELRAIEAEEATRKQKNQELRTQSILKGMLDAVVTFNTNGTIEEFNLAAEKIFGYTTNETIGKNVEILIPSLANENIPSETNDDVPAAFRKFVGTSREVVGRQKNGVQLPIQLDVSQIAIESSESEKPSLLFTGIIRDLSEQKKAEDNLNKALKNATSANHAKSEFLANMSHEIRTPLTAILGYTDLLADDGDIIKAPARRVQTINTIQNNANHLLTIINDILDMSKIEAGKVMIERIETDPIEIIHEIVTLMHGRADEKGIQLRVRCDGELPNRIMTDPTRFRQILVNLVGNAIKFTHEGQVVVTPKWLPSEGQLRVAVVDTGIGMTPEQRDAIAQFDAFQQADTSTTRKFGGSGLGLRISNSLAQMLGEGIQIESKLGHGSTFSIKIDAGDTSNVQLVMPTELSQEPADCTSVLERAKEFNNGELPLQESRILLAEDGPDNQRLISFILEKSGAQVAVAENGRIAIDAIHAAIEAGNPFDIVVMDMQMPELDGYGATRELRQSDYTGPIIALTAHAMAEDRQKCLDAGCTDFATKPINRSKLVGLIASYLESTTEPSSQLESQP